IAAQQLTGIQEPSYRASTVKLGDKVFIGAFAYLGEGVIIGNNVKIHPQVYIGDNVRVGDNTVLYPGVRIYHNCVVGKNVTIHAGSVIGADGFGFAPQSDGSFKKVPQIGNVEIEDYGDRRECSDRPGDHGLHRDPQWSEVGQPY